MYTENIDSNWKIICSIPTDRHIARCANVRERVSPVRCLHGSARKRLFAGSTFFFSFHFSSSLFKLIGLSSSSVSGWHLLVSFQHTKPQSFRSKVLANTHTHTFNCFCSTLFFSLHFYSSGAYLYILLSRCFVYFDVHTPRLDVGSCICTSLRNAFQFYFSSSQFFSSFMNGKHSEHLRFEFSTQFLAY